MKKHFILIILFCLFASCALHKVATDKEIDLYCQRLNILYQKLEAITSNMAYVNTTRTSKGGPYKRKIITDCHEGYCKEIEDSRESILKYMPKHPDANSNGYVAYPNIHLEEEQVDMNKWTSVFENIIRYAPVTNEFFLKEPKAKMCFDKYPFVDDSKCSHIIKCR